MSVNEHASFFPRRPESVAAGRAVLDELRDVLGERWDDVRLLVSELLTNAVLHGEGTQMGLVVRLADRRCRVEVIDGGHGFEPALRPVPAASPDGRGLLLVDAIAQDWGVYEGRSTHVWFEVAL